VLLCADPFGIRGVIPFEAYNFIYSSSVAGLYCCVFSIVFSWVTIIWSISGKSTKENRHFLRDLQRYIQIPFYLFYAITAPLQYSPGPTYALAVFRYFLLIILKLIFFGVAWKHGKLLYETLKNVGNQATGPSSPKASANKGKFGDTGKEKSQSSKELSAPASPSNVAVKNQDTKIEFSASDANPAEPSKITPSDYVTEKSSKESKLNALHTLLILYAVMTILVIVVIALLVPALINNLKTKYDVYTKPLYPQPITYYCQFEIVEYIVCCTLLFFFRKILLTSAQKKSRGSRNSEQQKVKKEKPLSVAK